MFKSISNHCKTNIHLTINRCVLPCFALMVASHINCGSPPPQCPQRTNFTESTIRQLPKSGTLVGGMRILPETAGFNDFGSLGIIVHDLANGRPLVLTACHVTVPGMSNPCTDKRHIIAAQPKSSAAPYTNIGRFVRQGVYLGRNSAIDWSVIGIDFPNWRYDTLVRGVPTRPRTIRKAVNGQRVKMFDATSNACNIAEPDDPSCVKYGIVTRPTNESIPFAEFQFDISEETTGLSLAQQGNSGSVVLDRDSSDILGLIHHIDSNIPPVRSRATDIDYILNASNASARYYDILKNPVPFFRWRDTLDNTSLYSTDWGAIVAPGSEADAINQVVRGRFDNRAKSFEGRAAAIFLTNKSVNGVTSDQFYHLYNTVTHDSLYTTSQEEQQTLLADTSTRWCPMPSPGYVMHDHIPGLTKRLIRWVKPGGAQHFYSINPAEKPDGWIEEPGNYWVFESDGAPDPEAFSGPALGSFVVDPACSSATVTANSTSTSVPLNGSIDLSVPPNCTEPACSLTVSKLALSLGALQVSSYSIERVNLQNEQDFYGVISNQHLTLAAGSVVLTGDSMINGQLSPLSVSNYTGPMNGVLNEDYAGLTLEGELALSGGLVAHVRICGRSTGRPPHAAFMPYGDIQCNGPNGATIQLSSAPSFDANNDIRYRLWSIDSRPQGANQTVYTTTLPLGSHSVGLSVWDSRGALGSVEHTIAVVDTQPPTLQVAASSSCLFPPNHKYVLYQLGSDLTAAATDACSSAPSVSIVNVTSNQPPNGLGSGNTSPDFKFGPHAVCVRAERDGTQQAAREYTITVAAMDASGNSTRKEVVLSVPHSSVGGQKCDIPPERVVDDWDARCVQ